METNFSHLRKEDSTPKVLEQVRLDLANYLDGFSSKTFATRKLAKETGLNPKTIKRLLAGENKPTYHTLFKLYSVLLDEPNGECLLQKCPKVIAKEIKDYNPVESKETSFQQSDFLAFIQKEPLLIEILILAGTGPLHKSKVAYQFGQYGLELLEKLIQKGFLKEVEKEVYGHTKNVPNFDGETLKFMGNYFVHRFFKTENADLKNQNVINFYAEGLNEEGKQKWLEIETKSFYEKVKLANDPQYQGKIPMFTFGAMDTLTRLEPK